MLLPNDDDNSVINTCMEFDLKSNKITIKITFRDFNLLFLNSCALRFFPRNIGCRVKSGMKSCLCVTLDPYLSVYQIWVQ